MLIFSLSLSLSLSLSILCYGSQKYKKEIIQEVDRKGGKIMMKISIKKGK